MTHMPKIAIVGSLMLAGTFAYADLDGGVMHVDFVERSIAAVMPDTSGAGVASIAVSNPAELLTQLGEAISAAFEEPKRGTPLYASPAPAPAAIAAQPKPAAKPVVKKDAPRRTVASF